MALRVIALSRVVFLLFLSLISFAAILATSEQCTYVVRVKTGDRKDAGTDSKMTLKLKSASGFSFTVDNLERWGVMGPGHDYFERGNLDVFSGRSPCLRACAMSVISNGEGNKPGWYLDYVEITMVGAGGQTSKVSFPVNQWLALDEWPKHLYANVNLCPRPRP
ncbi:PLAT domain-containing protein 3-like [Neltuma alba]|uniref:PLAT domain-containing protein 3-like n=1 Tax=Neltuma alba TaxID=207710 RepID=UPI0010A3A4E4|nr:PLAT domain-containing protein 3-like [Prosopis alba]